MKQKNVRSVTNRATRRAVLHPLNLLLLSAGVFTGLTALAVDKHFLVAPFKFYKSDPTIAGDPPNTIRSQYKNVFEQFWKENSYGKYTVDTVTFDYIHLPWPKTPTAGSSKGPDFGNDSKYDTGRGEVFFEAPKKYPYGGNENPIMDGYYTPGERFTDLDGNGAYTYADPWTDVQDGSGLTDDYDADGKAAQDPHGERFIDFPTVDADGNAVAADSTYTGVVSVNMYDSTLDNLGAARPFKGGEPFTDLNASGTYDGGTAGQYDAQVDVLLGPVAGIPANPATVVGQTVYFRDANGDGKYTCVTTPATGRPTSGENVWIELHEPFTDWNTNGVWDAGTGSAYDYKMDTKVWTNGPAGIWATMNTKTGTKVYYTGVIDGDRNNTATTVTSIWQDEAGGSTGIYDAGIDTLLMGAPANLTPSSGSALLATSGTGVKIVWADYLLGEPYTEIFNNGQYDGPNGGKYRTGIDIKIFPLGAGWSTNDGDAGVNTGGYFGPGNDNGGAYNVRQYLATDAVWIDVAGEPYTDVNSDGKYTAAINDNGINETTNLPANGLVTVDEFLSTAAAATGTSKDPAQLPSGASAAKVPRLSAFNGDFQSRKYEKHGNPLEAWQAADGNFLDGKLYQPLKDNKGIQIYVNYLVADAAGKLATIKANVYESIEPFDGYDPVKHPVWMDREPFEDFLVRWDPDYPEPDGPCWLLCDATYIMNNYPGNGVDVGPGWSANNGVSGDNTNLLYNDLARDPLGAPDPTGVFNNKYDIGEDIWRDNDADGFYSPGDTQIYGGGNGWETTVGTAGINTGLYQDLVSGNYWADRGSIASFYDPGYDIALTDGSAWNTAIDTIGETPENIFFADAGAKDGKYSDGEDIWLDQLGGTTGEYNDGIDIRLYYGKDGVWTTADGTMGINDGLLFNDRNGNLTWDQGENLWSDSGSVTGNYDATDVQLYATNWTATLATTPRAAAGTNCPVYRNNNEVWMDTEPAPNGTYNATDIRLYSDQAAWATVAGTAGNRVGIYFADTNLSTTWNAGEDVWLDLPAGGTSAQYDAGIDLQVYHGNGIDDNIEKLIARAFNNVYDGPEGFTNVANTKMKPAQPDKIMQSAWAPFWDKHGFYVGTNAATNATLYGVASDTANSFEQWWVATFHSAPPTLPTMHRVADPYVVTESRGWGKRINGGVVISTLKPTTLTGTNILPDASGAWYDGPREFRDMPSSMYHTAGDHRLGEQTDPRTTSIAGTDYGRKTSVFPDQKFETCGPLAYKMHGDHGDDAGDELAIEYLTWRTDGTSTTDNAYSSGDRRSGWLPGDTAKRPCKDATLDGLVDQGECPDFGYANYIADTDPTTTPDDGSNTAYPYCRTRVMEEIVEQLDEGVDYTLYTKGGVYAGFLQCIYPDGYAGRDFQPLSGGGCSCLTLDAPTDISFGGQVLNVGASELAGSGPGEYAMSTLAHEFSHDTWGLPDLYDYDIFNGIRINYPMGGMDIMAACGLTHYFPGHKAGMGWIEPRDLAKVLTPGAAQVISLYDVETTENQYYLLNRPDGAERYWFYFEGGNSTYFKKIPGMYLVRQDGGNDHAYPVQQRIGNHFTTEVIAADGLSRMQEGYASAPDAATVWPGSTKATTFNQYTTPAAIWNDGTDMQLEILNITMPSKAGDPLKVVFKWKGREVPELSFTQPPGGESISGNYNIRYDSWDSFGGTLMGFFYDDDNVGYNGTFIPSAPSQKEPGDILAGFDLGVSGLADGTYRVYALLAPWAKPQFDDFITYAAGSGHGLLTVTGTSYTPVPRNWSFTYGAGTFSVVGQVADTISGTLVDVGPFSIAPGTSATTPDGAFTFMITVGAVPWNDGDSITFTPQYEQKISSIHTTYTNRGTGTCTVLRAPQIDPTKPLTECSTFQNWTVSCTTAGSTGVARFQVVGDVTGVAGTAVAGAAFDSGTANYTGNLRIMVTAATVDFAVGDTFTFKTTGLTPYSEGFVVLNGEVPKNMPGTDDPLHYDSDGDGIADYWEYTYFGDVTTINGSEDGDNDGLTNYYEYLAGTDPTNADSNYNGTPDGNEDPDADGLTNIQEQLANSHPLLADTDDDGQRDGYEVANGGDPANSLVTGGNKRTYRALDLAGTATQFVELPDQPRFGLTSWSVEAWLQPDHAVGGTTGDIISRVLGVAPTLAQKDFTFMDSNPDAIKRANGSFIDDGFRPGQVITVRGGLNDGTSFTVTTITEKMVTLSPLDQVIPGSLTRSDISFSNTGLATGTIATTAGHFLAAGFAVGQFVAVTGGKNDSQILKITALTDSLLTVAGTVVNDVPVSTAVTLTVSTPPPLTRSDIALVNNPPEPTPDSITTVAGNFVSAGFAAGQTITVSGQAQTFTLAAVTPGTLTLTTSAFAATVAAGSPVTITVIPQVITLDVNRSVRSDYTFAAVDNSISVPKPVTTVSGSDISFVRGSGSAYDSIKSTPTTGTDLTKGGLIKIGTRLVVSGGANNGNVYRVSNVVSAQELALTTTGEVIDVPAGTSVSLSAGYFTTAGFSVGQFVKIIGGDNDGRMLRIKSMTPSQLTFDTATGTVKLVNPAQPGVCLARVYLNYHLFLTDVADPGTLDTTDLRLCAEYSDGDGSPIRVTSGARYIVDDGSTWTHAAATYDDNTKLLTLFVNGVAIDTRNTEATPVIAGTEELGTHTRLGQYFDGRLDDVRLWNAALTPALVASRFTDTLVGNEANLTAYCRFDDGTSTAVVWRDLNNDGQFSCADDQAWIDANADGKYTSGETVLLDHGQLRVNDLGKPLPVVYFDDLNQDNVFQPGEHAWIDVDRNGLYNPLDPTTGGIVDVSVTAEAPAIGFAGIPLSGTSAHAAYQLGQVEDFAASYGAANKGWLHEWLSHGTLYGNTAQIRFVDLTGTGGPTVSPVDDTVPPTVTSALTLDTDHDGLLDEVRVTFSESVSDLTFVPAKWKISTPSHDYTGIALVAPDGSTDFTDDNVLVLSFAERTVTGLADYDTSVTPTVATTATAGALDLSGNPLAVSSTVATDGAAPVIVDAARTDGDGYRAGKILDASVITVTFSEPVTSHAAYTIADFSTSKTGLGLAATTPAFDDAPGAPDAAVALAAATSATLTITLAQDTGPGWEPDATLNWAVAGHAANALEDAAGNDVVTNTTSDVLIRLLQPIYLTAVETVDANLNGHLDGLKLTFNLPLRDSTLEGYPGDGEFIPVTWEVAGRQNVRIDLNAPTGVAADVANNNILYVVFDEAGGNGDTGDTPLFSFPYQPAFLAMTGEACDETTVPATLDKAAPQVMDLYVTAHLGGSNADTAVVTFSEPLDAATVTNADAPDFLIGTNQGTTAAAVGNILTVVCNPLAGSGAQTVTYLPAASSMADPAVPANPIAAFSKAGRDQVKPYITSARTLSDRSLEIVFSETVNDVQFSDLTVNDAKVGANPVTFTTMTPIDSKTFVWSGASARWNTDATDAGPGALSSTDEQGNHQTTVPALYFEADSISDQNGNGMAAVTGNQVVLDAAAPFGITVQTADKIADGKVDSATVTFSEAVKTSTILQPALFSTQFTIGGGTFKANSLVDAVSDDNVIEVRLAGVPGTEYKAVVYTPAPPAVPLTDMPGNPLAAAELGTKFRLDAAAPRINQDNVGNYTGIRTVSDDQIEITFTEPLDLTSVQGADLLAGVAANITFAPAVLASNGNRTFTWTGASAKWNTDATGLTAGTGTDRGGINRTAVPVIALDNLSDGLNAFLAVPNVTAALDGAKPVVIAVTSSPRDTNPPLGLGSSVDVLVQFSEKVTASSGVPQLALQTSGTTTGLALYIGAGTTADILKFRYAVVDGDNRILPEYLDYIATNSLVANDGSHGRITDQQLSPNDAELNLPAVGAGASLAAMKVELDTIPPTIASAQTVDDNTVMVTFSEPIFNTGNEISTALTGAKIGISNGAGAYLAFDAASTDAANTFSTNGKGNLTVVYFHMTAAAKNWNTDATGTSAGAAVSTDTTGVHRVNVPLVHIAAAGLKDRCGTVILDTVFTGTTDAALPVSIAKAYYDIDADGNVETAQLRLSEPVSFNANAAFRNLWTVTANGLTGFAGHPTQVAGSGTGTLTFTLAPSAGLTGVSGGSEPALTYSGTVEVPDLSPNLNKLALFAAQPLTDKAGPAILSATMTSRTRMLVTFTEQVNDSTVAASDFALAGFAAILPTPVAWWTETANDAALTLYTSAADGAGEATLNEVGTVTLAGVVQDRLPTPNSSTQLALMTVAPLSARVNILLPAQNALISNNVDIIGSALVPTEKSAAPGEWSGWYLFSGAYTGSAPPAEDQFYEITNGMGDVTDGTFGTWIVNNLSGKYVLRLRALFVHPATGNLETPTDFDRVVILDTNPSVVRVYGTNGTYSAGSVVTVNVDFKSPVTVTGGSPYLILDLKSLTPPCHAVYTGGSGTTTLTFQYTVAAGDYSADLDYTDSTALVSNGAILKDASGSPAGLVLPAPGAVGSLGQTSNLVVDTSSPYVQIMKPTTQITLSSGLTAPVTYNYTGSPAVRVGARVLSPQNTIANVKLGYTRKAGAIDVNNPLTTVSTMTYSAASGLYEVDAFLNSTNWPDMNTATTQNDSKHGTGPFYYLWVKATDGKNAVTCTPLILDYQRDYVEADILSPHQNEWVADGVPMPIDISVAGDNLHGATTLTWTLEGSATDDFPALTTTTIAASPASTTSIVFTPSSNGNTTDDYYLRLTAWCTNAADGLAKKVVAIHHLTVVKEIASIETADNEPRDQGGNPLGDGKIDTMTVTFNMPIDVYDYQGTTDGLPAITVAGYTIANFDYTTTENDNAVLVLHLNQAAAADTGATPRVTLRNNWNIVPQGVDLNVAPAEMPDFTSAPSTDTAKPKLLLAETVADNQVRLTFSEAVTVTPADVSTLTDIGTPVAFTTATPAGSAAAVITLAAANQHLWNTDASGRDIGNGTDSQAVHHLGAIPELTLADSAALDVSANGNLPVTFAGTTDKTPPAFTLVNIASNNLNDPTAWAKVGDLVTLTFEVSETCAVTPTVIIGAHAAQVSRDLNDALHYVATATVTAADADGQLAFSIVAKDSSVSQNQATLSSPAVGPCLTTDGSVIIFDKTPPSLTSARITAPINLGNPQRLVLDRAKAGDSLQVTFASASTLKAGSLAVTIAGNPAALAGPDLNGFYKATYTMTGTETEGAVPFSISFTDLAGNAGTAVTVTSDASIVTFDKTAPRIIDAALAALKAPAFTVASASAKQGDRVQLTFTASEALATSVLQGAVPVVTIDTVAADSIASANGVNFTAQRLMLASDPDGLVVLSIDVYDLAGNHNAQTLRATSDGSLVTYDKLKPAIATDANGKRLLNIKSNNAKSLFYATANAAVRDTVTISFTVTEALGTTPEATLAFGVVNPVSHSAVVTKLSNTQYRADYQTAATDKEGPIAFTLVFKDTAGNDVAAPVTQADIQDGSSVTFDLTKPEAPLFTTATIPPQALNPILIFREQKPTLTWRSGAAAGDTSATGIFQYQVVATASVLSAAGWSAEGAYDLDSNPATPPQVTLPNSLPDGKYAFYVRERDQAGNWSDPATLTEPFTVDTWAPAAPVIAGATLTNSNTPTWTWTKGALSGNAAGNGIFHYRLYRTGVLPGAWSAELAVLTYTSLAVLAPDDTYIFEVQERDDAGNWSATAAFSTVVDTTAPNAPIVTLISLASNPRPSWSWVSGGKGGSGVFRYQLDPPTITPFLEAAWSTPSVVKNFTAGTPLLDGIHVLYVQERDAAGNWSTPADAAVAVDTVAPNVGLASAASNPTHTDPIPFTATFTKNVIGFVAADITVTNGTVSAFGGADATYSFSVKPTGQGTVTVNLAAGVCQDAAGNLNTAAVPLSRTYDSIAPAVVLASTAADPTRTTPIPFTVTFSKAVSGFALDDLKITNGTATGFSGSGASYSFSVTPTTQGVVTVNIDPGACLDAAGNANTAAAPISRVYDTTAPAVVLASQAADPTRTSPITFTATFTKPVTGFVVGDITVTNGTAAGFSGSGASYSFSVTPVAQGTVTVNIDAGACQDAAGNDNTPAVQLARVYDSTAPTLALTSSAPDQTHVSPIPFAVTFSETVTGFASGDITVTNGTVGEFVGADKNYSFAVTPTAQGSVTVTIAAGVCQDTAGNLNATTVTLSKSYETVAPTVTLASTAADPTRSSTIPVTATFSEVVIGFTSSDITVTNGTASGFAGSGSSYSFVVTPAAQGTVTVNIAANLCQDAAGNANTAATLSRVYDTTAPEVVLTSTATDPTNLTAIPVVATFTKSVTGLTLGDITVTNGSATGFSGSGVDYSFSVTPTGQGVVTVNLAAAVCQDAAGNANKSAAPLTRVYDTTALSVVLASTASNPTASSQIPVTATFSKAVTDFVLGDITVTNGTASEFSGTGTSYGFTVTPTGEGTVTVSLAAGVCHDSAGNPNHASAPLTRVLALVEVKLVGPTVPVALGTSFTVSVYVREISPTAAGFRGGTLDLTFSASRLDYSGTFNPATIIQTPFRALTSGTLESGRINELGGILTANPDGSYPVVGNGDFPAAPYAVLTFKATALGTAQLAATAGSAGLALAPPVGLVPTQQVKYGAPLSIQIQPLLSLSIVGSSQFNERDGFTTVRATLNAAATVPVTVNLAFSGTAIKDEDYSIAPVSGVLVIPVGKTVADVVITGIDDGLLEAAEPFDVTVDTLLNAVWGNRTVTCEVLDAGLLGDFNHNGAVDFNDLAALAGYYPSQQGDGTYDPAYDLNGDGAIDFTDMTIMVGLVGTGTPPIRGAVAAAAPSPSAERGGSPLLQLLLQGPTQTVTVGDEFEVRVYLKSNALNVAGLRGGPFDLTFDSKAVLPLFDPASAGSAIDAAFHFMTNGVLEADRLHQLGGICLQSDAPAGQPVLYATLKFVAGPEGEAVFQALPGESGLVLPPPLGQLGLGQIDFGSPLVVVIEKEGTVTMDLTLEPGWNLISMPMAPTAASSALLLDDPRVLVVWAWDPLTGYASPDVLAVNQGYFLYVTEPVQFTLTGMPPATLGVRLKQGWNLVGPSAAAPSPLGQPGVDACWHWGVQGAYVTLESAAVSQPGFGYWVHAAVDGVTIWSTR